MSMRISTQQLYNGGTSGIQRLQSELYTLQNQVDTGRKIVTPKDDPVGAAQVLVVTQTNAVNDLYIKNQKTATTKLGALDNTLEGVGNELEYIYEKAIAAGNGSYSDSERADVASELAERLKSLMTLANSQDGTGRYIFAGFQSTGTPFSLSGVPSPAGGYDLNNSNNTYVNYSGDDGIQTLQVSASQNLETSAPGSEVFMRVRDASGNLTGRSVFDAVQNMVDFLKTPAASASSATYTQALGDITASMDNVLRVRASVGSKLSSLDSISNMSADQTLQYKEQLSNLEDLDYASALSSVSQKKIQLDAAMASFTLTSKLSLFDYL